eukprot:PhF_6_TR21700/c0_g1_i1/m.30990/K00012/UGDH, ugd; UDPglucose 6-dehydrogenase
MIGIVGLGKLGLAIASVLATSQSKWRILGIDKNESLLDSLTNQEHLSDEPFVTEKLKHAIESGSLQLTKTYDDIVNRCEIVLIYVDTPKSASSCEDSKFYHHKNVDAVLKELSTKVVGQQNRCLLRHVVLCCTVSPGYCEEIVTATFPALFQAVSLTYNPQFVAQGNIVQSFQTPDVILIGTDNEEAKAILTELYKELYQAHIPTYDTRLQIMNPASAEICKLSLNCFITMKITFANAVGDIADRSSGNVDKHAILKAIGMDSRVGGKCLLPGYGYGGPCFPRDNLALIHHAESVGCQPLPFAATDAYNNLHADIMIQNFIDQNLERYVFQDVNYKPQCNVVILEDSQQLRVAVGVARAGKVVVIKDRRPVIEKVKEMFGPLFLYEAT